MGKNRIGLLITFALLVALILAISLERAVAQPEGGYTLKWWTVDGGGGELTGADYTLAGTAGQPEAGRPLKGSGYVLESGFWPAAEGAVVEPSEKLVYLPFVIQK
jgi:hypothetical protein